MRHIIELIKVLIHTEISLLYYKLANFCYTRGDIWYKLVREYKLKQEISKYISNDEEVIKEVFNHLKENL